jgi:hypothetical protein
MATVYKVLGQTSTAGNYGNGAQTLVAATNTNLYTVPAATQTVVSTINIVNTNSSTDTVRIAIRPAGAVLSSQHYIVYGLSLTAGSTFTYTSGATLGATDIITVYSTNGYCSFNAFGSEIA